MDVKRLHLLERGESDWAGLLADWHWILPTRFNLWLVNRYGDLFLILPDDGGIRACSMSAPAPCGVSRTARTIFDARLRQDNNANEWLMIPAGGRRCVAAGLSLPPAHCYGFKQPPALGGAYEVANTEVVDLYTHYSVLGQLHAQVWETLPGSTRPDTAAEG